MSLKQLLKLPKANKKALKKKYRPKQPDSIRLLYMQKLKATVLAALKELTNKRLKPKLAKIANKVSKETSVVGDSALEEISEIIDDIAAEFAQRFTRKKFTEIVFDIGRATAAFQAKELNGYFKPAVGVDVVGNEPWLRAEIDKFVAENVSLIKSIPQQYLSQVELSLNKGVSDGLRPEALAEILEERFGVAESRAALIARDQVGKFYGDLERVRQVDLGVTKYIWQTVNDNRVRPEHAELQGKSIEWSDPPIDGHPGEAINCRCYAEPDLSGILGE